MCDFNTGCPGIETAEGYFPCTEDDRICEVASMEDYPLESSKDGRYDRFAIGDEESIWKCNECGELDVDPDTHDEECGYI